MRYPFVHLSVRCFRNKLPLGYRALQHSCFSAGRASWTINVPTVDGYLKRPPDNVVGELLEIACEIGSHVYVDEEVAVIETDKVAVTVHAKREGIISAILAKVGDEVREHQPIYEAHDVSMNTGFMSRRWSRERARRRAIREQKEDKEREEILKMWMERRAKKRQEEDAKRQEEDKKRQEKQRQHQSNGSSNWHRRHFNPGENLSSHASHQALATLGLKPGASKRMIKAAFRKKAMQYHPDRNPDPTSAEKFRNVRAAYDMLLRN